jgi:hypothetical protein
LLDTLPNLISVTMNPGDTSEMRLATVSRIENLFYDSVRPLTWLET